MGKETDLYEICDYGDDDVVILVSCGAVRP